MINKRSIMLWWPRRSALQSASSSLCKSSGGKARQVFESRPPRSLNLNILWFKWNETSARNCIWEVCQITLAARALFPTQQKGRAFQQKMAWEATSFHRNSTSPSFTGPVATKTVAGTCTTCLLWNCLEYTGHVCAKMYMRLWVPMMGQLWLPFRLRPLLCQLCFVGFNQMS